MMHHVDVEIDITLVSGMFGVIVNTPVGADSGEPTLPASTNRIAPRIPQRVARAAERKRGATAGDGVGACRGNGPAAGAATG